MTETLDSSDYGDVNERTPLILPASSTRQHEHDIPTYYTQLSSMSANSNQMTQGVLVRNLSVDSALNGIPNGQNGLYQGADEADDATPVRVYEAAGNSTGNPNEFSFKEHFQLRLNSQYPLKYVLVHSIITVLLSAGMITCERLQDNHFTLNDFTVLSYRSLNGFILWAAATNILYSIMALVSVKVKRYFLIQLTSILFLTGAVMSFLYLIIFNIIVLVLAILDQDTCDYVCIIVRSTMILIGVINNVLNVSYYLLIQYNFLGKLNSH